MKKDGLIDLKQLEEAIRPDTALVSVMMVNNEIGTLRLDETALCTLPSFTISYHLNEQRNSELQDRQA